MLDCGCGGDLGQHAPLMLHCGHAHCKSCISHALEQHQHRYIVCTVCGKPDARHITQLPRNFALVDAAALDPAAAAVVHGFDVGGALWLDNRDLELTESLSNNRSGGKLVDGVYQGEAVTVRVADLSSAPFSSIQPLIRDATVALAALGECPFTAHHRGLTVKDGKLCLVLYEYDTTLATLLTAQLLLQEGNGGLPLQRVLHYADQLLAALAALHTQHVYGINLEAEYLMIDDHDDEILVSDIGLGRMMSQHLGRFIITAAEDGQSYMSPEIFDSSSSSSSSGVSPATDMWSWACSVIHMTNGRSPFDGHGTLVVQHRLCSLRQAPDIPVVLPPFLKALLARCLSIDPTSRPTAEQVQKVMQEHLPGVLEQLGPLVIPDVKQHPQSRAVEQDPDLVVTLDKQHKSDHDLDQQPDQRSQIALQQRSRSLSLVDEIQCNKPSKGGFKLSRVFSLRSSSKIRTKVTVITDDSDLNGLALQQLLLAGKIELLGGSLQQKLIEDKLVRFDHPLGSWYKGLDPSSWHGVSFSYHDPLYSVLSDVNGSDHTGSQTIINPAVTLEALHLAPLGSSEGSSKLVLKGKLPGAWSSLRTLVSLDLSGNGISGPLPTAWSSLTALTELDLSHNKLTWRLPDEWSSLVNLRELCLYRNQLQGNLPASWSVLTNLQTLSLYHNKFTGELPVQWSTLTNLETLICSENSLEGPLPASWGALQGLQNLRLSCNKFTGVLPAQWGALSCLVELSLSNNKLSGGLPYQWSTLMALCWLHLDGNQLMGPICPEWGGLSALKTLDVRGNKVAGGWLPREWRERVESGELHVYA